MISYNKLKEIFGERLKQVPPRRLSKEDRERLSNIKKEVSSFINKIHTAHKSTANSKLLFKGTV